MEFADLELKKFKLEEPESIATMIIECLCAECTENVLKDDDDKELLFSLLNGMKSRGLGYAEFNEILLLLNQDRVSIGFFEFFFSDGTISLVELQEGIKRYRAHALLYFGNFKSAYKQLIRMTESEISSFVKDRSFVPPDLSIRPPIAVEVAPINSSETWYTGYIAPRVIKRQGDQIDELINNWPESKEGLPGVEFERLVEVAEIYHTADARRKEVAAVATRNTDIYLTWDYMDIYIATSMRARWEFEETAGFIERLFEDKRLKPLNLRYFDPTSSLCADRIDKGLIEGLMVKRAYCTVYMAQETDTMGKDSELAATLAQGKPVIAYIPSIDIERHTDKIRKYPLDYFKTRSLILQAEGIFEDEKCLPDLKAFDLDYDVVINKFHEELEIHRKAQPFLLWQEKEDEFKARNREVFDKMCRILSIAEHHNYEKRARTLRAIHPLALQVNLASGVSNGVLVVRSIEQCADLLFGILTNAITFTVKRLENDGSGMTILEGYLGLSLSGSNRLSEAHQ
ncbi:MAG TPA: hypothetical protein VGK02_07735 [Candidatus Aquicultor sp.]|jgi:hypothetical protein